MMSMSICLAHFEATIVAGNEIGFSLLGGSTGVTVEDLSTSKSCQPGLRLPVRHHIIIGNTSTQLSLTTITQPSTLIADDLVESRGTFVGPNGNVNWIATILVSMTVYRHFSHR